MFGEGLLTREGVKHLRHRRALKLAFHPQRIADYLAHFARAARRAADRWSDSGDIDLVVEMSTMTRYRSMSTTWCTRVSLECDRIPDADPAAQKGWVRSKATPLGG
jgi:cytochrome P450